MAYSNNVQVTRQLPDYIATTRFVNQERKQVSPFFNKTIYYFSKSTPNPLVLPFNLTIDIVVHGDIVIGANKYNCPTFCLDDINGEKFFITGPGDVFVWYRYGSISPSDFAYLMNIAIQNNAYNEIDALLHTRSLSEAIEFILQHENLYPIFAYGFDWQLDEIGFSEFLKYKLHDLYNPAKLAMFLTIANYLFPFVFQYIDIKPINDDRINHVYRLFYQQLLRKPVLSEVIYINVSELLPSVLSEQLPPLVVKQVSEVIPEVVSEQLLKTQVLSEVISEQLPPLVIEQVSEIVPEVISEQFPVVFSEQFPIVLSEQSSEVIMALLTSSNNQPTLLNKLFRRMIASIIADDITKFLILQALYSDGIQVPPCAYASLLKSLMALQGPVSVLDPSELGYLQAIISEIQSYASEISECVCYNIVNAITGQYQVTPCPIGVTGNLLPCGTCYENINGVITPIPCPNNIVSGLVTGVGQTVGGLLGDVGSLLGGLLGGVGGLLGGLL